MYVEQLVNKNQFVIYHEGNIYFQSYTSPIARIDNDNELTLYENWSYSKTTLKHLKIFLMSYVWYGKLEIDFNKPFKKQIEKLISKGYIIRGY